MRLTDVIKTDAKIFRLDQLFLMHPPSPLLNFTLLPEVPTVSGVSLAIL
jgi:hypothetical protein